MSDYLNDSQALIDWSRNKDRKVQGVAKSAWNLIDDIQSIGGDAENYLPAKAASANLKVPVDHGASFSDPYAHHVKAYERALELAQKQATGASLDKSEAKDWSAWQALTKPID